MSEQAVSARTNWKVIVLPNTRRCPRVAAWCPRVATAAWLFASSAVGAEGRSRPAEPGAEKACTVPASDATGVAETIALATDSVVPARVLRAAIDLWSACANYGSGFPRLVPGPIGSRVIRVEETAAIAGRRCGSFSASTIQLHLMARDADQLVPCMPAERILAHEIGHALGLADAPAAPACRDHIMAPAFDARDAGRRVQPSECQAVGQHWLTPAELATRERLVTEWSAGAARSSAFRETAEALPAWPRVWEETQ